MVNVSEKHNAAAEQGRWKAKYLDALDDHERFERDAGARVSELGALATRLSRTLPGKQAQALQKRIGSLNDALKRNPLDTRLSRDVGEVNKHVLDFMDLHDKERIAVMSALDEAAGALESHSSQRKFKREIKKFRASLKRRDLPQTSELLGDLNGLHSQVFELSCAPAGDMRDDDGIDQAIPPLDAGAPGELPGVLPQNKVPAAEKGAAPAPALQEVSDRAAQVKPTDDSAADGGVDSSAGLPAPVADERSHGAIDRTAVREVLETLVARVELPSQFKPQMQALTQSIEGDLSEENLLKVLEQVRDLFDVALSCLNSEFRGFLDSVDQRLDTLLGAFGQAQEKEKAALSRGIGLADSFQASLDKMRGEAAAATELATLKTSIDVHLDDLVRSVQDINLESRTASGERDTLLVAMLRRVEELESESKQARTQLETQRRLALTDALTGLANRKALDERMLEEIELATQRSVPLSMAIADIDHFKNVNDTHGHAAGDRALTLFAGIVRKRIRAADFCARYGGEEFVMLFPATKAEMAAQVVEEVRAFVEGCGFGYKGTPVPLTASFGVTELLAGESVTNMLERADKAMYKAKTGGRNRVCLL